MSEIPKIGVPGSTNFNVTFMIRKTLVIPAKDLKAAAFSARKYMMQRGGREKCKLVSILPEYILP